MKLTPEFIGAFIGIVSAAPEVDTRYPYKGPDIPIFDWNDQTINGDGKGFMRLSEPAAVQPSGDDPTNNINVISLAYLPEGINIHYQTPFGLDDDPKVAWGTSSNHLKHTTSGHTRSYDRTPPCSLRPITQCSEFYHDVQLTNLQPDTLYYYRILASNGTTESDVLSVRTAPAVGTNKKFTAAVLNDMGYTNAKGTHKYLTEAATADDDQSVAFAWHGGDLSYADDHYFQEPYSGEMSPIYESNWDLWQQWMNNVTTSIPYMVLPGNHEAACTEDDGPKNVLTPYLNENKTDTTSSDNELTYYSCPPSQRNFTAFQYRFRMPGKETKGVSNFWYSFDYGIAHFISMDAETDYPKSPQEAFIEIDSSGHPAKGKTGVMNSGPFGNIKDNDYNRNDAYEQYNWLKNDLESVNRTKTPWVFVNSHRPMYSSQTADYLDNNREAFESLFLEHGVDVFVAGHIHWYERMYPMGSSGEVYKDSYKDNHTYIANEGKSMVHIVNGMAGNIESHSELGSDPVQDYTLVLDKENYGFSKLTVHNSTAVYWEFIKGDDGTVGDYLWLFKPSSTHNAV